MNSTGQDSEDRNFFSCVVVRFGKHAIDVGCSKQDVVSWVHQNIFSDLQVEVIVRLEINSTCARGISRLRGVGRLRHLHKKDPWLQDQVAAKNVQQGRVPSGDDESDAGTRSYQEVFDEDGNVVCKCLG